MLRTTRGSASPPSGTDSAPAAPRTQADADKASAATKFEARHKIYDEVQKLVYEDVTLLKLYDHYTWQGHSAKLQGYSPWVQVRLWNVWREK